MNEMMETLARSIVETKRDEITAVFNDYKDYINTTDIAYFMTKAFHDMIWNIEEKMEEK